MIIVTSGKRYIDIDAYAGCIAYAYLLNLKGIEAKAVSTAKINESITKSLLNLDFKLEDYKENEDNKFIITDVSNKEYFDNIVTENQIIEVIDHHIGYEEYWKNRLGEKAKIEFIGAVATIIVELYEKETLLSKMPKDIAKLLMSAILDNTLNFKAKVTTNRDIIAYEKLKNIINCEGNYAERYFLECQKEIEKNFVKAIENDTKIEKINDILPTVFGQLVVWDKRYILDNEKLLYDTLSDIGSDWMFNLICLKDEKSYIFSKDVEIKKKLEKLLNSTFEGDIMEMQEVWLRKEIIARALK